MPDILSDIKRDKGALLAALGLDERQTNHVKCVICGSSDALTIRQQDGVWFFKCYSHGGGGTVIDALAATQNKKPEDVCKELVRNQLSSSKRQYKQQRSPHHNHQLVVIEGGDHDEHTLAPVVNPDSAPERPRQDPVLDMERAEAFVNQWHSYLLGHQDCLAKRHISLDVATQHRLGYIVGEANLWPDQRRPHVFRGTWVLPITDDAGKLKGVKLHNDVPFISPDGQPAKMKCSWAPFGTEPALDRERGIKPVHSYYSLWPHPATLRVPVSEISSDWRHHVTRLPSGSLRDEYENTVAWMASEVAAQNGVMPDDLSIEQLEQAQHNAFDMLRDKIFKATRGQKEETRRNDQGHQLFDDETIFICPGELKALAAASNGFLATAITGGESWIPPRRLLEYFKGRWVVIVADSDISKVTKLGVVQNAGKQWAAQMARTMLDMSDFNAPKIIDILTMPRVSSGKKYVPTNGGEL
jgi:hypothetical protein